MYLGSKRHMMEQIFNDDNEPFWRSAKQIELGVIPPRLFADFIRDRFRKTGRSIEEAVIDAILELTHAHPYGTQELAYALWEVTGQGETATAAKLDEALDRVLRSETAHFRRIWEDAPKAQRLILEALAKAPGRPPLSASYRREHNLPGTSTVQRALEALSRDELIQRHEDGYRIVEPFLAEWILRNEV